MPPRTLLMLTITALLTVASGCATRSVPRGEVELLTVDDDPVAGEFNVLRRQGNHYFAGYPTEAGLRELADRGVTTVIALKTPAQVKAARAMDADAVAESLGLRMIWLPTAANTFSRADVDAFAEAYEDTSGPLLIHCGSSNTVGGLWAEYLHLYHDVPIEEALERGREVGLREGAMTDAVIRVAGEEATADER